jgi:1-acyl-sn-glycerol-3-phosphate acyltransferase
MAIDEKNSTTKSTEPSMAMGKSILGRIWAFWGLIIFMVSFIIIFLPSMLAYLFKDTKKGQAYFIGVSKLLMDGWLRLIGCPLKVNGKEVFKENQQYIVVFNHNAMLDVPLSAPHVPGANRTIAKASFARVPIFGWFYKRGSVLVNRNDDRSRIKSYEEMKNTLLTGMHMCIYPEGTRNRTDQPLKKFYDGAFKLAVDTKKEIIPCVISGTRKAMPIYKSFFLWPTKLQMDFLPPVSPQDKDAKSLKEKVFNIMLQHYVAKNPVNK